MGARKAPIPAGAVKPPPPPEPPRTTSPARDAAKIQVAKDGILAQTKIIRSLARRQATLTKGPLVDACDVIDHHAGTLTAIGKQLSP